MLTVRRVDPAAPGFLGRNRPRPPQGAFRFGLADGVQYGDPGIRSLIVQKHGDRLSGGDLSHRHR